MLNKREPPAWADQNFRDELHKLHIAFVNWVNGLGEVMYDMMSTAIEIEFKLVAVLRLANIISHKNGKIVSEHQSFSAFW